MGLVIFASCTALAAATLAWAGPGSTQQPPYGWIDNPPKTEEDRRRYESELQRWNEFLEQKFDFDFPAQTLSEFNIAFRKKTGLIGCYEVRTGASGSEMVGAVRGHYSAREALSALHLERLGLRWYWLADKVYAYQGPVSVPTLSGIAPPVADIVTVRFPRSYWGTGQPGDLEFVLVTATRLSTRASEAVASTTVSRQKIESFGVSTLADLLEYLPQIPFVRSEDYRASGEQYADLRGFGPGTTLILINGRRVAPSATSFDTGAFDVNTIPLTAVKRVEVLLDAPSVSIGTDAVGGVINILLKDDIPVPVLEFRYGAAAGGATERRASIGLGGSSERLHGAITLDVFKRDFLLGAERELTRDQDFRRFGGRDMRSAESSPGNISSLNLVNLPGLPSVMAAVPVGGSAARPSIDDFLSTAGQQNLTSLARYRSIVPQTSRVSVVASGEINLFDTMTGFVEFLGTQRRNSFQIGPATLSRAIVPASNAYNPFHVPVVANALLDEFSPRTFVAESKLMRTVTGVRSHWNKWETELSGAWNQERARQWRENELDPLRLSDALASSDPDAALNVFSDGPAGSDELLASLLAEPRRQRYLSGSAQVSMRAQGPMGSLPGGELLVTLGGEWRRDSLSAPDLSSLHRKVSAAFTEVQVPIVANSMNVRALDELTLSFGLRAEDLEDMESQITPQYGLTWRPAADFRIRASYSDNYRPPSLFDLHFPRLTVPVTLSDPARGNAVSNAVVVVGGNPDLAASSGRSWAAGIEFTPTAVPHLRVGASYWHAVISHRIAPNPVPLLISHEDLFPGRIVRAERTAQDVARGVPGALISVDLSPGNFGSLEADGADFNLAYSSDTRTGRFTPNLAATWYHTFKSQIVEGLPPQERVGVASDLGTIPKWRAIASLGWSRGPFAAFSALQFTSAYDDAFLGVKTGRVIPSQLLVDAQASLQLDTWVAPESSLSGVKLTIGATNLFDKGPRFSEVAFDLGYDFTQANLKQRFWYAELTKEF